MSRRSFLAGGAASLAAVALVGCGDDTDSTSVPTANRLRVLNWEDYVNPELLDVVGSDLAMMSLEYEPLWADNYTGQDLFGPQWDVVMPTNWLAAQYVQRNELHRLPLQFIPNHKNIDPVFLTNGWDRGARFNMPWQSGITGIAYDPELTGRELTSIQDLFAPDLAGRVAMIGEMREAVGLAMLANGADPARPEAAAAELALEQILEADARGQFHSWVFDDFSTLLGNGEVAATMAWSGDTVQLKRERPDIEFLIPEEGAIQWFDTMVIPANAQNVRGAAEWMNLFYDPALAARNTEWVQYISPVLGVADELRRLGGDAATLADDPLLFPDDETRRRLFIWGGLESTALESDLDDRFAVELGIE